jgi:hypothetical protein
MNYQFMKKFIYTSLLALIVMAGIVLAQKNSSFSFDDRWKEVESLAEKQLPESVLKEVELILKQAVEEKNNAEAIKAFVYKMRFTLEREPDKTPALISEFEAFAAKSTDVAERALLQSMTAELYAQHYAQNRWNIDQRTNVTGLVPNDINEWTSSIYYNKVNSLLDASLQNAAVLQKTDALKFALLLHAGDDSRTLEPTLFDFLAYRKIDILSIISGIVEDENPLEDQKYFAPTEIFVKSQPDTTFKNSIENRILNVYKELLSFHLADKNDAALLYADLQRLKYVYEQSQQTDHYLNALDFLISKNSSSEIVVEALAEKAQTILQNSYSDSKYSKRQAFDICAGGIAKYPSYKRIDVLKNIQSQIQQKQLIVNYKRLVRPQADQTLNVNYNNIETLYLKVYKLAVSAQDYYIYKQNSRQERKLHPSAQLVETKIIKLPKQDDFLPNDTALVLKTGDFGIYEFSLSDYENTLQTEQSESLGVAFGGFSVSAVNFISRKTEEDKMSVYVLDSKSGLPLRNARLKVAELNWNGKGYVLTKQAEALTGKNGFCAYPVENTNRSQQFFIEYGNDKFFTNNQYYYFNSFSHEESEESKISILTDRSIYRPGQTVYFKGISWVASRNHQEVNKNADFEVTLYDVNDQKISLKKFKSNEFGSFAGEFVLPQNGLNGRYYLEVNDEFTHNFSVEEYKRPTFEVIIPKPASEIRFNEKLTVKGNVKAFAGYDIANASVKYSVMRRSHYFCWWISEPEKELLSGTINSAADGSFEFSFVPEKPKNTQSYLRGNIYTYSVVAEVTQPNGETQQGEMSFSVGDKALFIVDAIPQKVDKNAANAFAIHTETINGEKVDSKIEYTLYKLNETAEYFEENNNLDSLKVNSKVLAGAYNTVDRKLALPLKKLKSGLYRLVLTTKDKFGNEIKTQHDFILYGKKDTRPPVKTYVWMHTENTECEPGEKAIVRFGTSTRNTKVLFEIMKGNKVLESKWIKFDNSIKVFKIPFKVSYGDGVNVHFTFMKDEKLFTRELSITKKEVKKELKPKFSVFRNKLLPGAHETWTVTIPRADKKATELLAAMYDASLDAIREHGWNFDPAYRAYLENSPIWKTSYFGKGHALASFESNYKLINEYKLDQLNWFDFYLSRRYNNGPIRIRGAKSIDSDELVFFDVDVESTLQGKVAGVVTSSPANMELSEVVVVEDAIVESDISKEILNKKSVKPRTNFAETAFFYPQLKTDAQGNVQFSFTAPESLTRWNVKLLAHTQDLYFGGFDTTAVTQKDLMVQMNLPRFVRRSDKLTLSANVINLTDGKLDVKVNFELINPETDKAIVLKDNAVRTVALNANETKVVEWEVSEFSDHELVVCKIIAESGDFSDGEQKYLPVLPDKVLVTESMPMIIRGGQTRTFNFRSLTENLSKVDTRNLTVEFTANPAWYAVQALPTLSQPDADNALSLFTAYYVNSLAGFIANSNPKIAKVFDQWKNANGSREALLSNLEKNQELKNMLLEETPWVMAAKDETEQKRQIALLFDLNMQKNQAQQYLDKLLKLQRPDGGFAWFEGMPSSRYITLEIMLNMARLNKMTDGNLLSSYRSPLSSALRYLDLEISHDFDRLKKYNKDYQKQNCIDNSQLFYLYMRSEYPDIPVAEFAREAHAFYSAQAEKYWTSFTLYGKAMMAVVAQRNGKTKIADQIMKSLRENALKTDEFGMYWAKNTAGYFWNERPVAIQAAMIEAFTETGASVTEIDEMKIWLLKQKQTQRWDSPVASVNAIHALLLQGTDWIGNSAEVKITVGNQLLTPEKKEAGTGYFKQSIPLQNIRPETGNVTVSTIDRVTPSHPINQSSIGWGAMYWQYYQDIDKVQGQSNALKVTKKLFVKQGNSMLPLEQTQLKKGDKVITRLVVTTDRNLEFVALKDLRASCFEPVNQLSGCEWKESLCYYQTTKDASTQFFFSFLPKGTYVFEYEMWANNAGAFTSGIATIQCQYAPEFVSHTGGEIIRVK